MITHDVRICICSYVHMCVCAYVDMFVCAYVHMFVCAYVHMFVCAYVLRMCTSFSRAYVHSCLYARRSLSALAGVSAALLGYCLGGGLAYVCGLTHAPTMNAAPFLVLGIGLDDTFVILNSYSLTYMQPDAKTRVKQTLHDCGGWVGGWVRRSVGSHRDACMHACERTYVRSVGGHSSGVGETPDSARLLSSRGDER
eukprot:GHVU01219274.1.p1 GENE.GHVU01219274.1~~GHVU01219274.1.p1  ORF type:complete len:197 (-),score=2.73 GHVU01219274.1:191-781(-)